MTLSHSFCRTCRSAGTEERLGGRGGGAGADGALVLREIAEVDEGMRVSMVCPPRSNTVQLASSDQQVEEGRKFR